MILLNSSPSQACDVMERLRQVMGSYRNEQFPELRVSLSIGLASYRSEMATPCAWLNEADKALYAAKNSGRDKVNFTPDDIVSIT